MAALVWDQLGSRFYQNGIDRVVLYHTPTNGVAWSGVTSIQQEAKGGDQTAYHMDGIKYHIDRKPNEYSAVINAITYPDELIPFEGYGSAGSGVFFDEQPIRSRFGLSYRTKIYNENGEVGYKLHFAYNLVATPAERTFKTLTQTPDLADFVWNVAGTPVDVDGFRPTTHIVVDSTKMGAGAMAAIEAYAYGTSSQNPKIPDPVTLVSLSLALTVVDNGDGTYTVSGPDSAVSMLDATTFQLNSPTVTVSGVNVTISST